MVIAREALVLILYRDLLAELPSRGHVLWLPPLGKQDLTQAFRNTPLTVPVNFEVGWVALLKWVSNISNFIEFWDPDIAREVHMERRAVLDIRASV
eukprot:376816-Amphidinium_carterae.1